MPDLERSTVLEWLRQTEPRIAEHAALTIRSIEDTPAVRALLIDLGSALDAGEPGAVRRTFLGEGCETARAVLAQLGPARMLRLIAWLGDAAGIDPEDIGATLLRDDTSEAGRVLRGTMDALHRQDLLGRIFAQERLQVLMEVCGEPAGEAA